ncbi:hypothetical protein [Rodentibacter caecimuris]|uniref:hypothetical protein n=1 Tax=Rodentibacter caecimuris TaxID=1796644 RepID=UPI0015C3E8EE
MKYRKIRGYSVDLANNTSTVTIASYISRKMSENGKEPIGNAATISLNLSSLEGERAIN